MYDPASTERPVNRRELAELARIGQRDRDREVWRAKQTDRRARKSLWGYSTPQGGGGGKRVRRDSK